MTFMAVSCQQSVKENADVVNTFYSKTRNYLYTTQWRGYKPRQRRWEACSFTPHNGEVTNLDSGGGGPCSLANCKLIFGLYYKSREAEFPPTYRSGIIFHSTVGYQESGIGIPAYTAGRFSTMSTVSKLTVMTLPINLTMYCGSSARFGSLTMPLRLSVFTRY